MEPKSVESLGIWRKRRARVWAKVVLTAQLITAAASVHSLDTLLFKYVPTLQQVLIAPKKAEAIKSFDSELWGGEVFRLRLSCESCALTCLPLSLDFIFLALQISNPVMATRGKGGKKTLAEEDLTTTPLRKRPTVQNGFHFKLG